MMQVRMWTVPALAASSKDHPMAKDDRSKPIPEDELYRLLVFGQEIKNTVGGPDRYFLSERALAERFGVTRPRIRRFMEEHHCKEQREIETRKRRERDTQNEATKDQRRHEILSQDLLSLERMVQTTSRCIDAFEESLAKGNVALTRVVDYERMVKLQLTLRAMLKEEQQFHEANTITLADVQAKRQEMLERLRRSQRDSPYVFSDIDHDSEPVKKSSGYGPVA